MTGSAGRTLELGQGVRFRVDRGSPWGVRVDVIIVEHNLGEAATFRQALADSGVAVHAVRTLMDVEMTASICPCEAVIAAAPDDASGHSWILDLLANSGGAAVLVIQPHVSCEEAMAMMRAGATEVLSRLPDHQELPRVLEHLRAAETGFQGSIHGIDLVDLLQMFHYARRSATITVNGHGVLTLVDGALVHARTRARAGEGALCELLALRRGVVRSGPVRQHQVNLQREFQGLLLDALRAVDESSRSWVPFGVTEPGTDVVPVRWSARPVGPEVSEDEWAQVLESQSDARSAVLLSLRDGSVLQSRVREGAPLADQVGSELLRLWSELSSPDLEELHVDMESGSLRFRVLSGERLLVFACAEGESEDRGAVPLAEVAG